ncbi:MAG: efflux RND transporter periplasmic adaptor subunit [Lachnospiraceae bacterium]|nr:efflux RND transporter periplasmic adaptor subunit [Lachnospiraceae bacterium]
MADKKPLSGVGKFFKKFRVLIIIVVVGFIILTFIRYSTNSAKKLLSNMSSAGTDTAQVEPRNLVETVTATGTVESAKTRTMASTIMRDTKITSVNCEVGDHVQEGDILVTFSYENINKTISQLKEDIAESNATKSVNDTSNTRTYYYSYGTESITIRDLQQAINEKQRDLDNASADYNKVRDKLDQLRSERDQMPDMVETTVPAAQVPGVSGNAAPTTTWVENSAKKEYDKLIESQETTVEQASRTRDAAQLAYDKAVQALEDEVYKGSNTLAGATETYQKNVITSNDQTKQLKRQLEEQEDKLDDYVITAPISGTVTKVNVEENNSFAGGDLVTIQDCSTLYISTEIDEYDIPNIQIGQSVKFKTDATRDDELDGVIDEIAATATAAAQGQASNNATYAVKVKVLTPDDRLKLGMTAKLSIITNEIQDVLTVPYDAVVDLGDGQFVVYTLDEAALAKLEKRKAASEQMQNAIADMQKGDPTKIQDMSKDTESANAINEAFTSDEDEPKGFFGKLGNIFKVAYGKQDDTGNDFIKENQIEVPVQVGMESDYYTQVSGAGIKEGMTVIIQNTEQADNPFELMMGL